MKGRINFSKVKDLGWRALLVGSGAAVILSGFGFTIVGSVLIGACVGVPLSLVITPPKSQQKALPPSVDEIKPSPWLPSEEGEYWQKKPYTKQEQKMALDEINREDLYNA